jgi:Zn-dependent protease with chaperone function
MGPGYVAALGGAVYVLFLYWSFRQSREGHGTWLRWVAVAAALDALALAPLAVGLALEAAGKPVPPDALATATLVSVILCLSYAARPVRLKGSSAALPEYEGDVAKRVGELAAAIGIPTPAVKRLASVGLDAQAWAGGLPAPTLVIADGIEARLTPSERDATLSHELGHLACGSLWQLAAVGPIAASAALLARPFVSPITAWSLGALAFVVVQRLVSRRGEVACDLVAGRAVGYATTAHALAKIHAVHPVSDESRLALFIFATTTHPPRAVRLAALRAAAPEAERATIEADPRRVRANFFLARLAFVVAIAAGAAAFALERTAVKEAACAPPFLAVMCPTLLLSAALRPKIRLQQKRVKTKSPDRALGQLGGVLVGCAVGLGLMTSVMSAGPFRGPSARQNTESDRIAALCGQGAAGFLGLAFVVFFVVALRTNGRQKRRVALLHAIRDRDWPKAIALGTANPKELARDAIFAHDIALATACSGDRARADAMFQELEPKFPMASLTLTVLSLGESPERALAAAQRAKNSLPGDPAPGVLEARALLRLKRAAEAATALAPARKALPTDGSVLATAALVELEQGNADAARKLALEALARAPGEAFVQLTAARVELRRAPATDEAKTALEAARKAVAANPFAFLERELSELAP